MKPAFIIPLLLILAGCTDSPQAPASQSSSVASTTTGSSTSTSKDAGSKATAGSKVEKSSGNEKTISHASDNPNRINQLRDLKTVDLKAAGQTVHAWIMDDESKRQEGMMFLTDKDVKENEGMIFVFKEMQKVSDNRSFWMHNCPLGLDIIYISPQHKVINVGDGVPQSDKPVPPLADYWYVLEMKRGWSKRHGLKAGNLVSIPDSLQTFQ